MRDFLQEIYSTIRQNKLRTFLTGLAVAWGIFILIVLMGAGNGLIHAMLLQWEGGSLNVLEVYGGYTTMPYQGMKEGRRIRLDQKGLAESMKEFPDRIASGGGTWRLYGKNLSYGPTRANLHLVGISLGTPMGMRIVAGRFINQIDLTEKRKSIVLFASTLRSLAPRKMPEQMIGQTIRVDNLNFTLVGVCEYPSMPRMAEAYIPLTTAQAITANTGYLNSFTLNTKGIRTEAESSRLEKDYRKLLASHYGFDANDQGAVWIWNHFRQYLMQQKGLRMLRIFIWVVGILTLLSGIVGVSNIMLITVKERTREFGIRKALGATPRSILRLIITESILITTFFGYCGMVLGILATEYMGRVMGQESIDLGIASVRVFSDPTVGVGVALQATLVLIVAGTLAGMVPARKAAMVRPIQALRKE